MAFDRQVTEPNCTASKSKLQPSTTSHLTRWQPTRRSSQASDMEHRRKARVDSSYFQYDDKNMQRRNNYEYEYINSSVCMSVQLVYV
ncbi:hypothetical protein ACLKA7_007419 [Drosophila subpalustris]